MEQKKHWQSFGELNNSEAFNKEVQNEFHSEMTNTYIDNMVIYINFRNP